VINEYNTVGNRIKPPYTSIVKYDLNEPAIKWRIGFGDDPFLPREASPEQAWPQRSTASSSLRPASFLGRDATIRSGRGTATR
jgi:hypothetical protein